MVTHCNFYNIFGKLLTDHDSLKCLNRSTIERNRKFWEKWKMYNQTFQGAHGA
jgi:hypothetical protein